MEMSEKFVREARQVSTTPQRRWGTNLDHRGPEKGLRSFLQVLRFVHNPQQRSAWSNLSNIFFNMCHHLALTARSGMSSGAKQERGVLKWLQTQGNGGKTSAQTMQPVWQSQREPVKMPMHDSNKVGMDVTHLPEPRLRQNVPEFAS